MDSIIVWDWLTIQWRPSKELLITKSKNNVCRAWCVSSSNRTFFSTTEGYSIVKMTRHVCTRTVLIEHDLVCASLWLELAGDAWCFFTVNITRIMRSHMKVDDARVCGLPRYSFVDLDTDRSTLDRVHKSAWSAYWFLTTLYFFLFLCVSHVIDFTRFRRYIVQYIRLEFLRQWICIETNQYGGRANRFVFAGISRILFGTIVQGNAQNMGTIAFGNFMAVFGRARTYWRLYFAEI